jgi:predicted TIM-barrel fold metal-dependent hydrolase
VFSGPVYVPEEMTAQITEDVQAEVIDVVTPEQALHMINEVTDVAVIGSLFKALPKELQANKEVIQFCKDRKAELIEAANWEKNEATKN